MRTQCKCSRGKKRTKNKKMKSIQLYASAVWLLLSISTTLLRPSLSELCNPTDKKVLLRIKADLGNPYHLASWDPSTDCCDWYVVDCDITTHRITALHVFQANISAKLPASIADLTYLTMLDFNHITNVTGTIPSAFVKLKYLTFLRLSRTNISGPVPGFLSELKNLTFLDLSFNNLTGSIPSSLSSLPNLDALHLDRNKLTGKIPDSFGKFAGKVPSLYLSHNNLSGTIPRSLGGLNFDTIDLSRNSLEGDATALFGASKTTQMIDLSRNKLEFNLSNVVFSTTITNLDLNHNKIYGSLPAGLTALDSLQLFNVSYNRLCGKIPTGGKLQSFDYSSYFHNRCLCGAPLPAC